ncbi:MAG TPA: phosphoribosyltransferase family protein [Chryseolinea sp.]|nr:phosphoribosyltransferase family protein [Chryseolinea sp.]
MNPSLTEIFTDFASLFFPNHCLACNGALVKGEEIVCTSCISEMPQTDYHLYRENALKARLAIRIPIVHAVAFFKFAKSSRVQHLLHALKYKNHPEIGVMLGKVYGTRLRDTELSSKFDLILPVPLHESRKRKRGYNQSSKFAEGLSEKLDIPYSDSLLTRARNTQTQTRKTRFNRWQNVSDVFLIKDVNGIKGKRILLVDDIITTGSTIEACGQTLINNGCFSLSIACLAEA